MRKLRILLVTGVISCWISNISAQSSMVITENFDGNTNTFTSSPASAWKIDTNYYVSSPNSIRGVVPNMAGDITTLTSPIYDFTNYTYVLLRFSHICKGSPQDIVRIEYKISGQGWQVIPASTYMGKATLYQTRGFSANSYTDWKANDSLALPSQSWWKEEVFDVSFEVGGDGEVQFRLIIQHGTTQGTQISYGWLIDNIEIIAAHYEVKPPMVEFIAPLIKDTVYSVGPWEINAKVKTQTIAQIAPTWLKYTATYNGVSVANDFILMTMVRGDSLWKASIPQFIWGTEVVYSITGRDMIGNAANITSGYIITKPNYHYGDTSVALTSIDSPIRRQAIGSINTPITVTIRNKGDSALTSASIHLSINGVVTLYPWTGNLPWDFEQQVTIGNYIPRLDMYDTVMIWVSNPNTGTDPVLSDDTLKIITYGCVGVSGIYTVGTTGFFSNLQKALEFLNDCSPSGDITFALTNGVYAENCDLTNISNLMGNHTLTITSIMADADSVILRPVSGVGIKLANSNNLVIKAITVDAAAGGTYAVQFMAACTNVIIRDCKLLANPTSTNATTSAIYKASGTGIVDSIFIINNLLDGGYCGFYLYGGTSSAYGTHVVFDSNTVSNHYSYEVYTQYVDFTSCSYNTIQSRTANTYSYWYGLYLYYTNGPVIGNRIIQRSNNTTYPYGIMLRESYYYNDTTFIANNEIILNTTSTGTGYGISISTNSKARVLHNSIYISGTGGAGGIYAASTAPVVEIKNNNIVTTSYSAYPVYLDLDGTIYPNQWDIDCNNMYAPTYVGYAGSDKTSLTTWQEIVTTDTRSISRLPNFINSTTSLQLTTYTPFYTIDILPDVPDDITGALRLIITSLGCYHVITPCSLDAGLTNLSGYRGGLVYGEQDTIKIVLFNSGSTPFTTANIGWSFNNVVQSVNWSGNLAPGQLDTIVLGVITYSISGEYTLSAWINNLGSLQDDDSGDDSISVSRMVCSATPLSGVYSIGSTGFFPSISAWQAVVTTDTHSVSIQPVFIDPTIDLQLTNYLDFYTDAIIDVISDITGALRLGITSLGCYHGLMPYSVNAGLFGLYGWRDGLLPGVEDTIKLLMINWGSTPLTTANIGWSYRNVVQPSVTWSGNLSVGQSDTVIVGTITYPVSGNYTLSAWINSLGNIQDEYLNNDTISVSGVICAGPLSGIYSVGATGTFPDLSKALNMIAFCGVSGDITFEIEQGIYNQSIDLTNISSLLGNYKLTITSATHHAEDVIFITNANGVGVTLSNSNNIVLKALTIDATAGTYAVQFTNACSNVVIRDCKLLANPTTTSSEFSIIYKASGAGIVDSIFIINNLLDGGYYGFNFDGGTGTGPGQYGTNVIFDSNTLSNQYYYATFIDYVDFISCSYNTILSRTANTNTDWYGLRMYYINGPVISNRIIQRSTEITLPRSIYVYYHNYYNTTDAGLIANNEIISNITGGTRFGVGIYAYISDLKILHNSIYVSGSGSARGIMVVGSDTPYEIKNNNIVMESSDAHPIYIASVEYLKQCDIDYNNMYAPQYVAYVGANIVTMAAWQQIVTTDHHSVRLRPYFIDSTQHLNLIDYTGLECPMHAGVEKDRKDNYRYGSATTMGAYHELPPLYVNAALREVINWREGPVFGQNDNISVILQNRGLVPLTETTIEWSFNSTSQTPVTWLGYLAYGESTIVNLGTVTYISSENTLQVWIGSLGTLTDTYHQDDTIRIKGEVCTASMRGVYTIGTVIGVDYTTITEALNNLKFCKADSNVIFEIQSGTYNYEIDLSNMASSLGRYSLSIISQTHNANDVIIKPTSGAGITLSKSNNIIIKDITVDVTGTSGTYAVQFIGTCTNIVIRDCKLLANPTSVASTTAPVYKTSNTGIVDSIFIINNLLDGGYYGLYFYGGSSSIYGTHVVFDSNTVSNHSTYGIYSQYTDFMSVSYNRIINRVTSTSWSGLYFIRCNGSIIGNHILQQGNFVTQPCGIYIQYFNYDNTSKTGLIANNEIIMNMIGAYPGIYVEYSKSEILHNSIYITGSGLARGIYIYDRAGNDIVIKNNNIVLTSSSAHPIYFSATGNLHLYDIDYNNLYAPQYIGYYGGNITTIQAWQQIVTTDKYSISINPNFIDPSVNLVFKNYMFYLCPSSPKVTADIQGIPRSITTTMGAYNSVISDYNLLLQNISRMEDEIVNNQRIKVGINIANTGKSVAIDSAIFRWSINGIIQPNSYKWIPASPLQQFGEIEEVLIDSFAVTGISYVEVSVWAEKINEGKDSIAFDDTVRKTAAIVPLAHFAPPILADTIRKISFDVYVKIKEGSGALSVTPVPKMNIQTRMSNGNILYDTVDMIYNNNTSLWVAAIPQQYYGGTVRYSLTISDTVGNSITLIDETYLKFVAGGEAYNGSHIAVTALQGLVELGTSCIPDYVTATVVLTNVGTADYDFSLTPVKLYMQVTQPDPFYIDTLISSGIMQSGKEMAIRVTNIFPTVSAGQYDIRIWIDSVSSIVYDDTLAIDYISGKFSLPIDEDFSNGISIVFASNRINSYYKWDTVSQGMGADTTVLPQFGASILAFKGSSGSMSTLSTQQLDLSRTLQPSLSFWYFHDTIPCEDYTDVRITVDGGTTYNTLFSLTKYNPVYGWQQYSMDLPSYAVDQCVILIFEAMEKSRSGNVPQYIDRILITAKQDIAISEIITSELTACDLQNKEVKIVLSNLTDPVLDFVTTPTTLTLEIKETGQTFTHVLDNGSLGRFTSDTISIATGVNFAKGTYTLKAYFSSVLDVDRMNDTLISSIVINPALSVSVYPESSPANCLTGELVVNPTITLYNTGNMDLSNIDMILQVDTGENNPAVYALLKETYTAIIFAGDTATYMFNSSYSVPWNARYDVRTYIYLSCDSAMVNSTNMVQECVDIKDLYIVSINNPSGVSDAIGATINSTATLHNRADNDLFSNSNITVLVEDSKGVQTESFTENLPTIGTSATVSHTFTRSYTVPNDSVYYLTVFVNSQDNYRNNDTMTIRRETVSVGIETSKSIGGLTLYQNIPNPANNSTRIDYNIPESGEVIFNLHSVSGQLLYSRTIEASSGKQSIELNTSSFAAGIYFYSIEYKGQRLVKRMMISD